MKAFHNDKNIQDKYLNRIYAHAKADEFVKGKYWQEGKGCAVGCTIHSDNHKAYETELGIPEWIARLEDTIFENLPNELAKTWPVRFLEAVNIGSDLETIKVPFIVYILNENLKTLDSLKVDEEHKDVVAAIEQTKKATLQMIEAQESGDEQKVSAAESAARSAWSAAESAAWSAAWSVAESAAESAARSAARSAAWSAWSAESAAESAAWSAAWSAARSAAESAAESAARSAAWSAAFIQHSDKLIELIKECK